MSKLRLRKHRWLAKKDVLLLDARQFTKEQAKEVCKLAKAKICIYCPEGTKGAFKFITFKQLDEIIKMRKNAQT